MLSKIVVWKLLSNIMPVVLKAKECGYQLASNCVCCASSRVEPIQHQFSEGELASALWSFFGGLFNIPSIPRQSIYARLAFWFKSCAGSSHLSLLGRIVMVAICRQLWGYKNNVVYGGCKRTFLAARMIVIETLQHADCLLKPKSQTSRFG